METGLGTTSMVMSGDFRLVSISGPREASLDLKPPGPLMIGRRGTHALPLMDDDHVSRDHAQLTYRPAEAGYAPGETGGTSRWLLADLGSRHGTWINGIKLTPERQYPLCEGDLVVIAPWTLRVTGPRSGTRSGGGSRLDTVDDTGTPALVLRIDPRAESKLARQRLALLLKCAGSIHAAENESALAEAVLEAAASGTGFTNVGWLRPLAADGSIEMVAGRGPAFSNTTNFRLSRSLIREASQGQAARVEGRGGMAGAVGAHSMVDFGIEEAVCAPISLGSSVVRLLYMDNRGVGGATVADRSAKDALDFAIGLAGMASMAMANQERARLAVEMAREEAELAAGAAMQRWMMPTRRGGSGPLEFVGESRPGRKIGGDFFDIIPLDEGRVCVAVGDVVGKGVAASVLMSATQGFLHSSVREHGDPAKAVGALNAFVHPRRPTNKFVTLWVGLFDPNTGLLRYVDAGHGYASLLRAGTDPEALALGENLPVGVDPDARYVASNCRIGAGDRVVVVSDGVIEQPIAGASDGSRGRGFGMDGVCALLEAVTSGDEIASLFDAVEQHAGTKQLADDATAVLVKWSTASPPH
ncbi:MAG: SpoIIE family protein phosphatase [Phycisphaerae bacterium]|nr:SpoIIE family protein phosphatase [Phycisphaerae bacterium]